MRKRTISLVVVFVLLMGISAFAELQTGTLTYKTLNADYKLDVTWRWFNGDDEAVAETKFVNPDNSHYVAVRLEMWETSDGLDDYKYERSKTWAQTNYTWTHVEYYKSRHSIDSTDGTKELVVKSLSDW